MTIVLNVLIGILGLGIIVFIHELGHFIACKLIGVDVEVFSLGWGKKLVGFTHKGTLFKISVLPIGGYCKIKGDEDLKQAIRNNAQEVPKTPGSFHAAPPWKKIFVHLAGPLANLIFAVLVFTIVWWIGFNFSSYPNKVVLVNDYSIYGIDRELPATTGGLKTGDTVLAIDDQPIDTYSDLSKIVAKSDGKRLKFYVQRDGQFLELIIIPELNKDRGVGFIGVDAWIEPVIENMSEEMKKVNPWFKPGDRFVAIDDNKINNAVDMSELLIHRPSQVSVTVNRDGEIFTQDLVLSYSKDPLFTYQRQIYRTKKLSLPGAFVKGIGETIEIFELTFDFFCKIFQGINLSNAIAGPGRIIYFIGEVSSAGFSLGFGEGIAAFFDFICILSVIVLIMNLLPIPVFDGGFICLFFVEMLRRKSLKPSVFYKFQIVGFFAIILLFIFAIYNDVVYFIKQLIR